MKTSDFIFVLLAAAVMAAVVVRAEAVKPKPDAQKPISKGCETERWALITLRDNMRLIKDPTPKEIQGWIEIANKALGVPTNQELAPKEAK